MRSIAEHRRQIAALGITARSRTVALTAAVGAVLGEAVRTSGPLPAFDVAAVDGFAVRHGDLRVDAELSVPGTCVAGPIATAISVSPGQAVQIMTGAPVPPGADTVVPVEDTSGFVEDFATARVQIRTSPKLGANIRARASDIGAHEILLPEGTTLSHNHIGALSALGLTRVQIRSCLRVAVVPTGNELVRPGTPLLPGQIHESNAPMIVADLARCGAEVRREDVVGDDVESLRATLGRCADWGDLIVTTGGVSAGTEDVVRSALDGSHAEFVSVAMKPGKPQGAGRFDGVPIISLPGNPVAAFVSYEMFVRPVVRGALGCDTVDRPTSEVVLDSPTIVGRPGMMQFRLGRRRGSRVVVAGSASSGSISSMASSDCLIAVGEGGVTRGSAATVWMTGVG